MRDVLPTTVWRLLGKVRSRRLAIRHVIGGLAVGLSVLAALGVSAALSGGALSTFDRPDDRYEIDVTSVDSEVYLSPERTGSDGVELDPDAPAVTIELEAIDASSAELSVRLVIQIGELALNKVCFRAEGVDATETARTGCGYDALKERYWPSTQPSAGGSGGATTDSVQDESLTMILVTRFASTETQLVRFPMMKILDEKRKRERYTSGAVNALLGNDIRLVDAFSLTTAESFDSEMFGSEFYPNDLYTFEINLSELRLSPTLEYRDTTPDDAVPARYYIRSNLENDWQVLMEDRGGDGQIGMNIAVVRSSTRRAATWLLALIPLVVIVLGMAANRAADSTAMAWGASSIAGLLSLLTVRGLAVPAEIVGVTFFDKILGVELLIGLSIAAWYLSRVPALERRHAPSVEAREPSTAESAQSPQ